MGKIIVLCGKSASGKDTLVDYFKQQGFSSVISHTTRPIRDGEVQDVTYHYISNEEMEELIDTDQLIESRKYNTKVNDIDDVWFYGVHENEIEDDKTYIHICDLNGLRDFKKRFGNKRVYGYYLDVDAEVRTERAKLRGSFDESEWNRRLEADEIDFQYNKLMEVIDEVIDYADTYTVAQLYEMITDDIYIYSEIHNDYFKLEKEKL